MPVPPSTSPTPPNHLQRSRGIGRLSTHLRAGQTRITRLYQEGSAKIRTPKIHAAPLLEAVMMNTSGGLTGGDRLDWKIDLDEGSRVALTTPTCEKIYRSLGDQAEVDIRIDVGAGAVLSYLPQETLLFEGSALDRNLTVNLSPTASALFVETTLFGRLAMAETVRNASFRDSWRIRQGGVLVHAEATRFQGDIQSLLQKPGVTGSRTAIATLLVIDPNVETLIDSVRAQVGDEGGASVWSVGGRSKMLVRLAAPDGFAMRQRLLPILLRCNKFLLESQTYGLPKVWNL